MTFKHIFRLPNTVRSFFTATSFMSKKSSKKRQDDKLAKPVQSPSQPISLTAKGEIQIKIHAKPGAKFNNVTDISEEGVGIQIAAPPVDGEANAVLVKYVSTVLGLRKSDVTLDRGSKSRCKTIIISTKNVSVEDITAKFHQVISENNN